MHGRVQGVWVEASTALELEQGRRTVGHTGELCAAVTADAEERRGAAPEQMRGRRGAWGIGRA
jgi:protein involved in temperature-dependent protein secretion